MKPHAYISDLITLDYLGGLSQIPKAELLNVYIDRKYRRIIFFGSQTCSLNFEDIQAISWKDGKTHYAGCQSDEATLQNASMLEMPDEVPTLQISCNTAGSEVDVMLQKKNGLGDICAGIGFALATDAAAGFDVANRPAPQIPKLELGYTIAFWLFLSALVIFIFTLF